MLSPKNSLKREKTSLTDLVREVNSLVDDMGTKKDQTSNGS